MKLYECEGKAIFRKAGIVVPSGGTAASTEECLQVAEQIGYPCVLKIQAMSGGRGKAGGVKLVYSAEEAAQTAPALLAMVHKGEQVTRLLVEQKIDIKQELYAGITMDVVAGAPLLMICAEGGMDIEQVAAATPEKIIRKHLSALEPIQLYEVLNMLEAAGVRGKAMSSVAGIILKMARAYFDFDAITMEINPLVILQDDKALAADSKVEIDDSSLYRQKKNVDVEREVQGLNELEQAAREQDLAYVGLDGTIGLICGGAGLGMATMDNVKHGGGKAANFLDLGGNATPEKTAAAMRLVMRDPRLEGFYINVFGGINNCLSMAKGICEAYDEHKPDYPVVVKMRGHNQDEGWAMLEERGIPLIKFGTTAEGVELLMKLISEKKAG